MLNITAEQVLDCERPKQYFFDNEEEMIKSLKNVKHGDVNFEGYVIVDDELYFCVCFTS